jgi:hypothetical protein
MLFTGRYEFTFGLGVGIRRRSALFAISTEGVVFAMSSDQARTARKSDQHLDPMRWKVVAEERAGKDEDQAYG